MHQHQTNFIKLVEDISYRRPSLVLDDFMSMAMVALANPVYKSEKLEQKYLSIMQKYPGDESKFSQMLAEVIQGLEVSPKDFLGEIYMEINGNHNGQFFTPYSICEASVKAIIDFNKIDELLNEVGYFTVAEPACGAGVMLIALRNVLKEKGYGMNSCFAVATDVDKSCVNMTYIQLSLLGFPALVRQGNSLNNEIMEGFYTAPYFLSGFYTQMKLRSLFESANKPQSEPQSEPQPELQPEPIILDGVQLSLFN